MLQVTTGNGQQVVAGRIGKSERRKEPRYDAPLDLSPLSFGSILNAERDRLLKLYPFYTDSLGLLDILERDAFTRAAIIYETRLTEHSLALESFAVKIGGTE